MATTLSRAAAAAIVASALFHASASGQETMSNHGTLTCTIGDTTTPGADISLSCNFKATEGPTRDYTGVATRQGTADFPPGKHVLVWSVLAPPSDGAPTLNGMFRGESGGPGTPVLVGGENGSIKLEPVAGAAQIDASAALTVITLRLAPTRA
jgi:hypothetical protein